MISNHLANEERFRTPELLQQHGIQRAMNVILQGDGKPFGVLEVDSRSQDEFIETDLAFLQGAANILGMAIERDRHERTLNAALERQQFLVLEMNHRVKNSLAIVAGMLRLQASDVKDTNLTQQLNEASLRVAAVARAHDHLYRGSNVERLDVGNYIETVCKDVDAIVSGCDLHTVVQHGIEISTDRAISSALIVNELITNAVKYAYQGQSGGKIWVTVARAGDDNFSLSVRDEGAGLPEGFDPDQAKGLGMRIINSFSKQLSASLTFRVHNPGTEFILTIPKQSTRDH